MLTGLFTGKNGTTINIKLPLELRMIKNYLSEEEVSAYLVGGYIRDTLLQRDAFDIDIAVATDALSLAREITEILKGKYILLDQENNIARVVFYQQDKQYYLDISALRGDIERDLSLRDFTIDAIAIAINKLQETIPPEDIIDPFQGRDDIKNKIIRAVSKNSFQDDPIRMLRAVRLAAELGFSIEQNTESLITEQHHLLVNVAMERINEELCRLFSLPGTSCWLRTLDRMHLLGILIPELDQTKGIAQPREHYWDVYNHLIETVAAVELVFAPDITRYENNNPGNYLPLSEELQQYFAQHIGRGLCRKDLMKIAALLHDIAKPQDKIITESGRTRFFGHDKDSAGIAAQILTRLRFSNRQINTVQKIIELHMRVGQMAQPGEMPTHRAIYRFFRDAGDVAIDTLFFSLADHLAARGPNLDSQHWIEHTNMVRYILSVRQEKKEVIQPPKLLDGYDLMNIFGLQPGPEIKKALETIREMQAMGEITTREEALVAVRKIVMLNED